MGLQELLLERIDGKAELILGEIENTVDSFIATLDKEQPIGFVSIDVDIYSSAKSTLRCLNGDVELYSPVVSLYFDDVGSIFANRWCGELAAIEEYNVENSLRKIDQDRSILKWPPSSWSHKMYVAHVLDHPARNSHNKII